jgi:hypothetical protein
MTDLKQHWVLVEGPAPGDTQFLGRWLLAADRADKLLRGLFEQDPEFKRSVARIELYMHSRSLRRLPSLSSS